VQAVYFISILNQFTFKRWLLVFQGDYGGFFINSKYSNMPSAYRYYRKGKSISFKLGWNYLSLNHQEIFMEGRT